MTQQEKKKLYCKKCNAQTAHKPVNHPGDVEIADYVIDMPEFSIALPEIENPFKEGWACMECGDPQGESGDEPSTQKKQPD